MELIQLLSVIVEIFQARTVLVLSLASIYSFYYHPLRNIPGPRAAAISNIPYCWWFLSGRQPYKMIQLHNKYGNAQSWRDIYGGRPGHETFVKGDFYSGGSFAGIGTTSIISERRPEVHKQMRTYLAGAFSDRSILEQEKLVADSVDEFIHLVAVLGSQTGGFNMTTTLQSLTFDITGNLSFGTTFGALKSEKLHPWISVTLDAMTQGEMVDILNRFPILGRFLLVLLGSKLKKLTQGTKKNEELSYKAVRSRITRKTKRRDFLTRILEDRDPTIVTDRQIAAHASDLVLAGSDTTATTLAAAIYYLLRDQSAMARLTSEVRSTFTSYVDITHSSTASLQYLRAVILEALRLYPPVPMALPRIVPDGGDTVDGFSLPAGVTVSTNPMAASLAEENFQDPWSFKAERWIQPSERDNLNCSQPFSLGARGCIGRNLAWLDMRTILAKLVWVYDLELMNSSLDWHEESRMHTLWRKPDLMVRAKNRGVDVA
ncbi:benzoate 4-monooxygenase cytochrome P450 [Hypoxylon rubiginosum]|uniref:Benzoate 4-monooxygenase cytochrome P450 n=1 Tax=Hypoxylon rubiginosum TaxID=110542 RepID=A0ACC0CLC5_9PEZI|nr:benzoate 4-monooxygenase cytochrome P450 [Hypoxylon rubiginosum]